MVAQNTVSPSFQQMGNLDYFYLIKELEENLCGGWLNQVYDSTDGFRFKFRKLSEKNLVVQMGVRTHLVQHFSTAPNQQTSFTKYLREHLSNAKLESIKQIEFDRILRLEFSTNKPARTIIIEQFGEGNMIVLGSDEKILRPMRAKDYSSRSLHHDINYKPPVTKKIHPDEFYFEKIEKEKIKPDSPVVSLITHLVNLPPYYAQEVMVRAGLKQQTICSEMDEHKWKEVASNVRELCHLNGSPRIYYKVEAEQNIPIAYAPFELKKLEEDSQLIIKKFDTFSETLEEYYLPIWRTKIQAQNNQSSNNATGKLNFTLNEQIAAKEKFSEQIENGLESGKWIMGNSQLVEQLIVKALEFRKSGLNKERMELELNKIVKTVGLNFEIAVNSNRLKMSINLEKKE